MMNRQRSVNSPTAPSPPDPPPAMSLTISLPEIYAALCPACQEAFLALLESKARGGMLRETLRRQLVGAPLAAPSDGPAGAPA